MRAAAAQPYPTMKYRKPTASEARGPELFRIRPENTPKAIDYFKTLQVHGPTLATEPDGLYTWILKRMDKAGTLLLVAGRTRSGQEIGTLHQNLYDYSPVGQTGTPDDVFAAGEFMKTGGRLLYNIQSGSFMGRRFDQIRSAIRKDIQRGKAAAGDDITAIEALKSKLLAAVHSHLTSLGFEPVFAAAEVEPDTEISPNILIAGKPMINVAPILTRSSNIERYLEFANPEPYVPEEPKPKGKGKK
jgi:hypothetical protein